VKAKECEVVLNKTIQNSSSPPFIHKTHLYTLVQNKTSIHNNQFFPFPVKIFSRKQFDGWKRKCSKCHWIL